MTTISTGAASPPSTRFNPTATPYVPQACSTGDQCCQGEGPFRVLCELRGPAFLSALTSDQWLDELRLLTCSDDIAVESLDARTCCASTSHATSANELLRRSGSNVAPRHAGGALTLITEILVNVEAVGVPDGVPTETFIASLTEATQCAVVSWSKRSEALVLTVRRSDAKYLKAWSNALLPAFSSVSFHAA